MKEPVFLRRYQQVEKNELPPRYKICRLVPASFEKAASLEELWAMHQVKMQDYRKLLASIDINGYDPYPSMPRSSLLDLKVAIVQKMLENCHFCERRCGVNRKENQKGHCRAGAVSGYASEFLHTGEEPELVPSHTIFFTGCVFSCIYCQNWDIATHPETGKIADPVELAKLIEKRRMQGSRNVNFVTPTPHPHAVLRIISNLSVNVPVIWNSNMYHSKEVGELLEGVVDVYLADLRYGNDECAEKYSKVNNYIKVVTENLTRAYSDAEILLRHLVLPEHVDCCTRPAVKWVKENIPHVRFNPMFQYTPHYLAYRYPEMNRHLRAQEIERAVEIVLSSGLEDVLL